MQLGGMEEGELIVVHNWVDLHGFRCCDNIAPNAKCQRVLVLTLRLVTLDMNTIMDYIASCWEVGMVNDQCARSPLR